MESENKEKEISKHQKNLENKNNKNSDKNNKKYKDMKSKHNNLNADINEEITGFLLFTDKNREKNCLKDAYNILNDVTEKIYPHLYTNSTLDINEETDNKNNILSEIDKEIKLLKKTKKFFMELNTRCAAVIFIKIESEYKNLIFPKEIIEYIIKDVINTKKSLSKYISKFYPIEICIKYSLENFKIKVKELIEKYFKEDNDKIKTWKIELRIRNNNSINKKELMDIILKSVNINNYKVDYKKPELTFLVEISCNLLCLSVLENYFEYKGYNIQSLSKTDEEILFEKNKIAKLKEDKEIKDKEKKQEKESKESKIEKDNNDEIEIPDDNDEVDLI